MPALNTAQAMGVYRNVYGSDPDPATAESLLSSGYADDAGKLTGYLQTQKQIKETAGAPKFDLVAATNAAYNTPEILAAQTAIKTRQQALSDAQAGINDNPFYSEATRVGKSEKLTLDANNDIMVQQNNLNMLRADAAIKVNAAQGQYDIENEQYKTKLNELNNMIANGGLDNAPEGDLTNISIQTGIPVAMLKSVAEVSRAKNTPAAEKPQIITSTDNVGNLSILAVDPNGTIINQTQIAGVGKAAKTSSGGGSSKVSAADEKSQNKANLVTDIKNKVTLKSLVQHYGQALSIDDIYKLYASNSPWGAPKETLAQVKAGQYASN